MILYVESEFHNIFFFLRNIYFLDICAFKFIYSLSITEDTQI